MKSSQVILSFTDCWQAIKQARWLILASALFLGTLLFVHHLLKPPTFTARGTFKGSTQAGATGITKALEFLGGGESYSLSEDPKIFLRSYPVMEDVVRGLHLQVSIREKKRANPLKQIWHTLKAERAQRLLKNKRVDSPILRAPVASKMLLPDQEVLVECAGLEYPGLVSSELDLLFLDEHRFQVVQNKNIVGSGELNQPFYWEGGFFTLISSSSVAGKAFHLTFIPLHAAAKSLEQSLLVKRSKEHNSLVHLSFTHPDRHLATAIVNTAMEAFQKYLKEEGKQKISKQLGYLQQRHEETIGGLEAVMEEHKAYLESHLDSGELFLLGNELGYMVEQQKKARSKLDKLAQEMQAIHLLLDNQPLSFSQILECLRSERPSHVQTLTLETARELILEHEQAAEYIQIEQDQYDYCLAKLSEPEFDASSLSKLIDDPTFESRFDIIHELKRNLIDDKNWTAKERQQLQEDLDIERKFLVKHIEDLKRGAALKDDVLRNHLRDLHKTMLFLLLENYEGIENQLRHLALKASHFPQQWLTEQKIDLNTKLHVEMIESITKMIEAKNIGYHLDYLGASPLMCASLPIIPNSPHLLFGFFAGSMLGAFLILAGIFFREVRLGPTASYINLKGEEKEVIPFAHTMNDLKNAHYHLKSKGKILLVAAKNPAVAYDLGSLFSKGGEKILIIDVSKNAKSDSFTDTEYGQMLVLGSPDNFKEVVLGSTRFQTLLDQKKQDFDRIILVSLKPFNSLEIRLLIDLADHSMLVLREERWNTLPHFPDKILYAAESTHKKPVTLTQIVPFLERVTSFSFWNRTPRQNSPESQQIES